MCAVFAFPLSATWRHRRPLAIISRIVANVIGRITMADKGEAAASVRPGVTLIMEDLHRHLENANINSEKLTEIARKGNDRVRRYYVLIMFKKHLMWNLTR